MPSKTQPDKMLPVTFGTHKKQKQCFCPAPSVRGWFRNHWRKSFGGRFETPEQQQDSSPCQAKRSPTKCFPLLLEPIKNSSFVRHPRCEAGSQTIGARPLEAKCFPLPLEPIKNSAFVQHPPRLVPTPKSFGGRFRNTRTAAGFEPMPSKTHTEKVPNVTFGIHFKEDTKQPLGCGRSSETIGAMSFGGRFRNTRTAAGFEPMPSKTQPDKMLPVTFGTYKKQFFCPAPSVRGWFPNHWRKTLGGGDPTKCLAHAKQNPAPQNASPYLWNR